MEENNTFLVSDESVNSYGFSVLTSGIDLTKFLKNPIMLYMHERPEIIGYWTNVQVKGKELYADAVFDTESERGKEVARQVQGGFLRGASIGIVEIAREGDVITQCELAEISIVDIGSNANALKLYKESPEMIHLSMSTAKNNKDLGNILGLSGAYNQTDIIKTVRSLKNENTKLNLDLNVIKTGINNEREEEAERLTNLAVQLGYIPENLRHIQKLAFKEDFQKTKSDLQEMIDKNLLEERRNLKHDFINGFINSAKVKGLVDLKHQTIENADKSNWTLTEYRKFAPKELEENPELYKKLIDNHYNK